MEKSIHKQKYLYKTWGALIFIYFLLVLLRCVLMDYGIILNKEYLMNINTLLKNEPKLFFIPISFFIIPFALYYFLKSLKYLERILFLLLIIISFLSLSRLYINYPHMFLIIVNHGILFLLLIWFYIYNILRKEVITKMNPHL